MTLIDSEYLDSEEENSILSTHELAASKSARNIRSALVTRPAAAAQSEDALFQARIDAQLNASRDDNTRNMREDVDRSVPLNVPANSSIKFAQDYNYSHQDEISYEEDSPPSVKYSRSSLTDGTDSQIEQIKQRIRNGEIESKQQERSTEESGKSVPRQTKIRLPEESFESLDEKPMKSRYRGKSESNGKVSMYEVMKRSPTGRGPAIEALDLDEDQGDYNRKLSKTQQPKPAESEKQYKGKKYKNRARVEPESEYNSIIDLDQQDDEEMVCWFG